MSLTENYPHLDLNEDEVLSRLVLNASDAARVCGVSTRQLTYWTDKGIIPTTEGSSRAYSIEALARAILIRKAMENGNTLEKAVELVNRQLAARERRSRYQNLPDDQLVEEVVRYLLRLEKGLAAFQARLPTYLALCKLMALIREIEQATPERMLEESPFEPKANEAGARELDHAIDMVKRTLVSIQRELVLV